MEITVRSTLGMAVVEHHRAESRGQAIGVQLLTTEPCAPAKMVDFVSSVY